MSKSMWVRCPECGEWCYAEKKNFFGRLIRSLSNGDQQSGKAFGDIADYYTGLKGLGKTVGRALNAINVYQHGGEMLNGDNYLFQCHRCNNEFGTDDENVDMTPEYNLYTETVYLRNQFKSVKSGTTQEKEDFIGIVEELLAKVENVSGINDAKAVLHDILSCCYFYFKKNSSQALLEINKSLDLCDDASSHVLKGLFLSEVSSAEENFVKMNELLKIHECESILYVDKPAIEKELELSEKRYDIDFLSIPANQRKFLVITSHYTYMPQSFKVIKYNHTELSGIVFENGFPNNNGIYVCHPYKSNVYYPSESYQSDLFKNQLNEFRELLQCLGAKCITTENSLSAERRSDASSSLHGKIGGEYKGVGGSISGGIDQSNSVMDSMVQTMLIDDGFSFNPDMAPHIPNGLVWFNHMEEWQRLSRMRLRGQNRYSICISSKRTNIVNENEANQVNADFKALVANVNVEISKSSELKAFESNCHEWKLVVEFYPLSDYKPSNSVNILKTDKSLRTVNNNNEIVSETPQKFNFSKKFLIVLTVILLSAIIGLFLFFFA